MRIENAGDFIFRHPIISTPLSAIILAGGRSSRMGRDKAMIEIDGVPMLRRIYDVVAGCEQLDQIYVVTPWQRYRSILPDDCNFILEQQPHQGPLVAFSQGLAEITSSSWVLLLACDLPNLSTPVIQAWIDRLPAIDSQSIAYLPRHLSKGWEPLCGFYRQICHESAIEYLQHGGQSFQGWLKMNVVTELVIANPLWLTNWNTPEDLERL